MLIACEILHRHHAWYRCKKLTQLNLLKVIKCLLLQTPEGGSILFKTDPPPVRVKALQSSHSGQRYEVKIDTIERVLLDIVEFM